MSNPTDWLNKAYVLMAPMIKDSGHAVATIRSPYQRPQLPPISDVQILLSYSFDDREHNILGQACSAPYSTMCSSKNLILIHPGLYSPPGVLATLLHEMIHLSVGCGWGHRGPFRRLALKTGLLGPMRSTMAGPALRQHLCRLCHDLGPMPWIPTGNFTSHPGSREYWLRWQRRLSA